MTAATEGADRAGGAATTGSGRVGNVDVLRAVAALAVLVGHAYALGGRAVPIKAVHWYDVLLFATTSGVWLFFAISGYVISRPFIDRLLDDRPPLELVPYALRRCFRIFPLYWIALTAVIVMVGFGATQPWQVPFHYLLLQNIVPGQQEALLTVAWTLTLEVLFYIAVPLLVLGVRRWSRRLTPERLALYVCVSWIASIGLTLISDGGGGSSTALWLRGLFPMLWQMFCPGILLAIAPHLRGASWRRWIVELPRRRGAVPIALCLVAIAAIVGSTAPLGNGLSLYVTVVDLARPLYAIGYGLILAWAIRARPWSDTFGSWVLTLGLVSYGIYLYHAVLGAFFTTSFGQHFVPLPHDGLVPFIVHVIFLAGLTIPIAIASWRWLERPMLDIASDLSSRWQAAQRPTAG